MKCPKCGYLGFEEVDRCRNCGYEFSLSSSVPLPELVMREKGASGDPGLEDLPIGDHSTGQPGAGDAGLFRESARRGAGPVGTTPELPLFDPSADDDRPLITRPSPPRTPLAVRRATPEVARLRTEPRTPMLDLRLPDSESAQPIQTTPVPVPAPVMGRSEQSGGIQEASAGARLAAAVIDLAVLAAINAAVVYFTMQICGITLAEVGLLPKTPLAAFLVALDGGYFVTFTVGGQTLGKMILGIRVVASELGATPDVAHAAVRTLVWTLLAAPAGLGFLTAAISQDGRGLHDRCAGTRVVRVGAPSLT